LIELFFFCSQIGYEAFEEKKNHKGSIKLFYFLKELRKKNDCVLQNILNRAEKG